DRQRHEREGLQRALLRTLALRQAVALLAGAEMRAERAPPLGIEASVELTVDREGGLLTAQLLLELLAERAPGAEEKSLERRDAHSEDACDLVVRASLELAHHERGALVRRQLRERAPQLLGGRPG